jgi:hypothetical protein
MKSSAIRHPEGSYFIRRHDWQVKACELPKGKRRTDIPHCAAEILSVMEFHFNNKLANRILFEIINRGYQRGHRGMQQIGDWMPYPNTYLQECLLGGRGNDVIADALALLVKRGFVTDNVPEDIQATYPLNCGWYKLEVDFINKWIDDNIPKSWISEWQPTKRKRRSRQQAEAEPIDDVSTGSDPEAVKDPLEQQINWLCKFHSHIHGKTASYIYDKSRRGPLKTILKAKRDVPGLNLAAQAIIGCVVSDYHQARHENNKDKVYDDMELIFRNEIQFAKMRGYAEAKGITSDKAIIELQSFLAGGVSQYAKKVAKEAQTASNGQQSAFQPKVEPQNAPRYRAFARQIAGFFISECSRAEILEFCKTRTDLGDAGVGIVDEDYLAACIQEGCRVFRSVIPETVEETIKGFSATFTQIQRINS